MFEISDLSGKIAAAGNEALLLNKGMKPEVIRPRDESKSVS